MTHQILSMCQPFNYLRSQGDLCGRLNPY
jgi:hypothetical protein